jgi:lipoprotein-releasing system permease protein
VLPALLVLLARFFLFTLTMLGELRRPRSALELLRRSSGTFEAFVGLRYLKARKNQSFISAITLISIVGVMVGVCALVVVLSVMSGFEEDLKGKILGTNSHAIVLKYGGDIEDYPRVASEARTVPGVLAATPFIYSEVMLTAEATGSGVIMKGIDPSSVGTVTDLVTSVREGLEGPTETPVQKQAVVDHLDDHPAKEPGEAALPGLLVGEELARTLHIIVGDVVTVVSPLGEVGPMGTRTPKFKRFMVAGIFRSGMYEYDAKFTYVSLKTAQDFLAMGDTATGVELKVNDIYKAKEIGRAVEEKLRYPFWTRDWMSMNKNLFSALYLEKIVMGIILGMIVMVAALNIISALIMVVIEKGKEIAILKAMGASGIQIMKVFMIEGLIIGFIGTTLGLILGFILCYILAETKWIKLNPDVYYLDTLPVQISLPMFAIVALAALTISFVATLYPSWQASKQDPVEGLRYE